MKQVSHLLNVKGWDVWSLPPDATVYEAIDQMAQKEVGALLVMEGEQLVGIVSERDYARKVILKGKSSRETRVSEIMSHPVISVRPELTCEQAMAVMADKRVRHLLVMVDEKVVGVNKDSDLLIFLKDVSAASQVDIVESFFVINSSCFELWKEELLVVVFVDVFIQIFIDVCTWSESSTGEDFLVVDSGEDEVSQSVVEV